MLKYNTLIVGEILFSNIGESASERQRYMREIRDKAARAELRWVSVISTVNKAKKRGIYAWLKVRRYFFFNLNLNLKKNRNTLIFKKATVPYLLGIRKIGFTLKAKPPTFKKKQCLIIHAYKECPRWLY